MSEEEKAIVVYISLKRELRRRESELNRLRKKGISDPQRERIIEDLKAKLGEMD